MKTRLFTANFTLLWLGQATSCLGNGVGVIATMWWIQSTTGSAWALGAIALVKTLTALLVAPWAGVIVDRTNRKNIIVTSDLVRGVVYLGFAWLALQGSLSLPILCLGSCLSSASAQFFSPAVGASMPLIVPLAELQSANALRRMTEQTMSILSYGVGGILVALLGIPMLLLFDGCSFLLSAVSEAFIKLPAVKSPSKLTIKSAFGDFRDGLRFARADRRLAQLLVVVTLVGFCFVPFLLLLPKLVQEHLGAGSEVYGYITGAQTVGMLLGTMFTLTSKDAKRRLWLLRWGIGIQSVLLGSAVFWPGRLWTAHLAIYAAFGFLGSVMNIAWFTTLQRRVPQQYLGKVLGLANSLNLAAQPFANAISGALADGVGLAVVFIGAAVLGIGTNIRLVSIPGGVHYLAGEGLGGESSIAA